MVVVSGGADTLLGVWLAGPGHRVPLHQLKCFWWWGVDICGLWCVVARRCNVLHNVCGVLLPVWLL